MDGQVFMVWLSETRVISKDPLGRKRIIFLDNCSGHGESDMQTE